MFEETRAILKNFMEETFWDSVAYIEHSKRKTLSALDLVYALKRKNRTLYGFDCN